MEQEHTPAVVKFSRVPWNKGKLVGAKPPLAEPRLVDRNEAADRRQEEGSRPFNLAVDSKL